MNPAKITAFVFLLVIAQLDAAQSNLTLDEAGRHLSSGRFKEAESIYAALAVVAPNLDEVHTGLIRTRLEMNNVAGAILAAREGLRALPNSAPVLSAAGDVQFRIGQFNQALVLYESALQADANLGRAWWGMGRIELALSMRKSAREHFTKAYAVSAQDPDIIFNWANTRETPQQIAEGLERYVALAGFRGADHVGRIRRQALINKHLGQRKACTVASPVRTELKLRQVSQSDNAVSLQLVPPTFRVDVSINAAKSGSFGLSPGNGITLSPAYARKAGVSKLQDPTNTSDNDYVGIVNRAVIGGVEFQNCVVNVAEIPGSGFRTDPPTGTFGLGLLSDFVMTVDFRKRTITLDPLPSPPDGEKYWTDRDTRVDRTGFTPVWEISGQPAIQVRVNSSQPLLFLISFGSNISVIAPPVAQNLGVPNPLALTSTYSGPCSVSSCVSLAIGAHSLKAELRQIDLSRSSWLVGTEVSGTLGYDVLSQFVMTMDLRNGFVKFDKSR